MPASAIALILKRKVPNFKTNPSNIEMKRFFNDLNACVERDPKSRVKDLELPPKLSPMKKIELKSFWPKADCCNVPCEQERHDIKFLKPTLNRIYTRTWVECKPAIKEKYLCVGDNLPPEVEFRKRRRGSGKGGKNGCVGNEFKLDLMRCAQRPNMDVPCPKIRMPGCRAVAETIKCTKARPPACCQKRCTQYPSFSECRKAEPKKGRPIECPCLKLPLACEVLAMLRRHSKE